MTYQTQKLAYPYFVVALALFPLQLLLGLWLATNYFVTLPQGLVDVLPFSAARAIHTNLLVLWLLLGFMGATFYLVPEEAERELAWPRLAIAQLVLLTVTGVAAVVGFLFGWTQGRPLLEIPRPLDFLVVAGALMFLANVGMTMLRGKKRTATQGTLLAGLVCLAVLYLFGIPFYRNLAVDWYYWWWVIHLWVEGSWELITAAITAFMLIKLTGVERRIVERWLYVELGLFLFTGIAGTGHHYYWLGAPSYWLWVGAVFSALEPLPIALMVVDTFRHTKEVRGPLEPRLTWTYLIGGVILHFVGAGLFGLAHTFPQINYYTHGSQVTVAHGHLAFYGAYVLLNLTFFYFAMPRLRSLPGNRYDEKVGQWGFWLLSYGVVGMSLAFAVAGVLQAYLERVQGLPYMVAARPMRFWVMIAFGHGVIALAGGILAAVHLLTIRQPGGRESVKRSPRAAAPAVMGT
ncbi:MAG: nitric-oxide reductase [Acidobacteria bacterium]|nr:MAG: nitric-oxide reductase [Acidobacteriota bacterium]RPJ84063.1 MAG: nitric-oxide reductase [Acidobacteriota bacterium]